MEQPDCRLAAEFRLGGSPHEVEVVRHMRIVMTRRICRLVPAVIPRIECDDLEVAQECSPKADIAIGREAVAVADDEPRAARIAVPAQANRRCARSSDVDDDKRVRP
jgi:hypothetical protein